MLQAIRKANPGSDFLYVVDTRPKVSVAIVTQAFADPSQESGPGERAGTAISAGVASSAEGLLRFAQSAPGRSAGLLPGRLELQVLLMFPGSQRHAGDTVHNSRCVSFSSRDGSPKSTTLLFGVFLK